MAQEKNETARRLAARTSANSSARPASVPLTEPPILDEVVLFESGERRLVAARNTQRPVRENAVRYR